MTDRVLGWLVRTLEKQSRSLKAYRCQRFGHSYQHLTGGTWNCRKCGKLKLLG